MQKKNRSGNYSLPIVLIRGLKNPLLKTKTNSDSSCFYKLSFNGLEYVNKNKWSLIVF